MNCFRYHSALHRTRKAQAIMDELDSNYLSRESITQSDFEQLKLLCDAVRDYLHGIEQDLSAL